MLRAGDLANKAYGNSYVKDSVFCESPNSIVGTASLSLLKKFLSVSARCSSVFISWALDSPAVERL